MLNFKIEKQVICFDSYLYNNHCQDYAICDTSITKFSFFFLHSMRMSLLQSPQKGFYFGNFELSIFEKLSYIIQCCQKHFFKNCRCWGFPAEKEHFIAISPVLLHFYVVMYWRNIAKWLKWAILAILLSSKIADLATYRLFW